MAKEVSNFMNPIIENSLEDSFAFFRDLTDIEFSNADLDYPCIPNGPGCSSFDCFGCPTLC